MYSKSFLCVSLQGTDGVEYLYIPVDSATLKQFIEDQQNSNTWYKLYNINLLFIPSKSMLWSKDQLMQ